jgi:selenocysteine lyase/cysteine desulfurase
VVSLRRMQAPTLEEVRALWEPDGIFLNSATYGLPPAPAWDAMQAALESWRNGTGVWESWADEVDRARRAFARIVSVPAERVVAGASTAELLGLVAASLADGAHVLAAEGEFTSLVFPFAAHASRNVSLTTAPLDRLAGSIRHDTNAVLISAVQSSNGAVADLDAIRAAAGAVGALTVVDATQACGWLPFDAGDFDAVACSAYKWLMAPRGVAFLVVGERLAERLTPLHANWFAGDDIHGSYYGLPLRLAPSARRLDTSPAWFSWVAASVTLELLESIGIEQIHDHNVRLANRFRAGVGLAPSDSAIVSVAAEGAADRLEHAGIRAATRAGGARLAFHLYNTEAEADAAAAALG